METPEIYTHFHRPLGLTEKEEVNSGEVIVEKAGYVPPNVQIQELLEAGERLAASRMYEFGPDEEVPDDYVDPTRGPGFDLVDASLGLRSLEGQGRRQYEEEQAAKAAEAAQLLAQEKRDLAAQRDIHDAPSKSPSLD